MNLIEKTGFFVEYFSKVNKSFTESELTKLETAKSDVERVTQIFNSKSISDNQLEIVRNFNGKSKDVALDLKAKGNAAFQKERWNEALILYNKSLITIPGENESEMSVILANRSAALFHLEKYDEALEDLRRAIGFNYPKEMLFKLEERRARCYLAKKDYENALNAFKNTVVALDDSKQPLEKRSKIERDALVMIKMLERETINKKNSKKEKSSTSSEKYYVNDALTFEYNEQEGRVAKAQKEISIGDKIVVEKPNACVLLEKYCKTHCNLCFLRTTTPVPCPRCVDVVFCSEKCLNKAETTYHKYECGILTTLWRSGTSINCQMAIRIISNKSFEYFSQIKGDIEKGLDLQEIRKFPKDDYRQICFSVSHSDKRSANIFFHYTVMAHFLTSLLQCTSYFEGHNQPDDVYYIGSLILRNLQFLQYNAHEIFELHQSKSRGPIKTVFIGAGIYPTVTLFNHSCNPGIVKYFCGTTVHVNAIKPVAPGEIVAENYGPIYTQESKSERQAKLRELYQFDCDCEACADNWPCFDDMNNSVIRFRCDSDEKCNNILEIPANCNDFMIKCNACGQFTNILKGLKVMQDTEMINKAAKRLYDTGNIAKALLKYIDLLKIMHEVLAPPFIDYCLCQQNIKDCFIHFGNSYMISE